MIYSPERRRLYYQRTKEQRLAKAREWRLSNKEKIKRDAAAYYRKNKNKIRAQSADWHERNKGKVARYNRAWTSANKEKVNFRTARRRARTFKAIPKWANLQALERVYAEAAALTRSTGIKHQVDHIVPLNSHFVCGLHVEANLQVVSASDNRRKSNSSWPDMP